MRRLSKIMLSRKSRHQLDKLVWAENEANQLLKEFTRKKRIPDGWQFKWSRGIWTIGYCDFSKKTIFISKNFVLTRYIRKSKIREVILHELCHIIGSDIEHGKSWIEACRLVGIKPRVIYYF